MWGEPIKSKKESKKIKAKLSVWQWSDLITMSFTLTEHSIISGTHYYLIIVSDTDLTLNCIARYSELLEFKEAHHDLSCLPFPPKLFPLFSHSHADLDQRRIQLEQWMQSAYASDRKLVQNFVQELHLKHERMMAGSPTVSPSSPNSGPSSPSAASPPLPLASPPSSASPPAPVHAPIPYDATVYDDAMADDGKTSSMYISDIVDLRRYDPARQKFQCVANNCRLRGKTHQRPLCLYSIDNQELVVFFAPWERTVSLGLLTDILGTQEKLQVMSDFYYTVMLGNKFYLLYMSYFVSCDVITLECEKLPFPPKYNPSTASRHGNGYPIFEGSGKRIHLIDKEPKLHEIFDTENKTWTSSAFPPGLENPYAIIPRAVVSKGNFYIFCSKLAVKYLPETCKWESLPIPPIRDYGFAQIANDPAMNNIWMFDGFNTYSFNTSSHLWTAHPEIPMMDSKKTIAKLSTLFFSSMFESADVSKLEDQMSFYISRGPNPWKDLYRQDKINDEEENLITQFETCPLPEKATLLKKSTSEYLPLFEKLFRKRIGFERATELIWQVCREDPSLSEAFLDQITAPYWTLAFTIPVDGAFTFITRKQSDDVKQNRMAMAQQKLAEKKLAHAATQAATDQASSSSSSSAPAPIAVVEEPPPTFTPEMEASLIGITEKTARVMQALEAKSIVPPQEFVCPITQHIMWDPVATRDGHAYERLAILQWFSRGNKKSPLTNQDLPDYSLVTPHSLKTLISDFLQETGALVN